MKPTPLSIATPFIVARLNKYDGGTPAAAAEDTGKCLAEIPGTEDESRTTAAAVDRVIPRSLRAECAVRPVVVTTAVGDTIHRWWPITFF